MRHVGIMMLTFVIIPNMLFYGLIAMPETVDYGLLIGTLYYGVSYFLFDYWIVSLRGIFALISQSKADILVIFVCWTLVSVGVALFQVAVARFFTGRKAQ
jgi:hypothetical protein